MKFPAVALAFALITAPLFAADWPVAFERYEALAIEQETRGDAVWQMFQYARATGRLDELKQRWKEQAVGENAHSRWMLLGLLSEWENQVEAAREYFGKAIEAAPGNSSPWWLRGQWEAGHKIPEARETLEKASELEFAQGRVSLAAEALANEHWRSGRLAEAREVWDRAIPATRDVKSWLRMTQRRAALALSQRQLGDLIARLEAAPPDPLGGSESAQAYYAAQDYLQAAVELERERKQRPEDSLLRLQQLEVARAARHAPAIAQWFREETKLAPTPENRAGLFRALVNISAADEALAALKEHGAALFSEPLVWRDAVSALWQLELARPTAEALAKAARQGDWESALVRGELLIAEKDWAPAEEDLWSILDPKCEEQPISVEFRAAHSSPFLQIAAFPGVSLDLRVRRLTEYLDRTPAPFNPRNTTAPEPIVPVQTVYDARDLAVLYLAMIAAETQRAPAFISRLHQAIAGWPRSERLLAWTIVQNPAGVLEEMEGCAGEPRTVELDRFCRDRLPAIRRLLLTPEEVARATALAEKFPEASSGEQAVRLTPDFGQNFRDANKQFREGRLEEALKTFEQTAAAYQASGNPFAEREMDACAMSFAFLLPELRGGTESMVDGAVIAVRSAFVRNKVRRWPSAAEGLQALLPSNTPALAYRFFERGTGNPPRREDLPESLRDKLVYPPAALFNWDQVGVLWMVFGQTRELQKKGDPGAEAQVWPILKKRLDAKAAQLSLGDDFLMRTAAAYFAWWNQEPADAIARMKQLLTEFGDPAICLGLASMLREQGDLPGALAVLGELKLPTPGYARAVKTWRLALMAQAHDTAAAAAEARELADSPWEPADLRTVIALLDKSGCADAAEILRPHLRTNVALGEDIAGLPAALTELNTAGARAEAVALAKRVLASTPSGGRSVQISAARVAALKTLETLGEQEAYAAELARETEAAPENIAAWQRLALASKGNAASTAWRKVLELQPNSPLAVSELSNAAAAGSDEQRSMLVKWLAIEPEEAMARRADLLFSSFEAANKIPELADAIAKAPFRPAGWRAGTQNSAQWRNLAQRFVIKSRNSRTPPEREAAILVMRKAISTFDPVPPDLRRMLLQQLVAMNRNEEAGRELVECLSPGTALSPALFAWRNSPENVAPGAAVDVALLKMAQSLGVAPELRARVEKAAARDATARAVLIFLRVTAHDLSVLPDVLSLIPQITARSGDISWVLPIARELAAIPEAGESSRKILAAYDSSMGKTPRYSMTQRLEVARLTALAGGKEEALLRARAALEMARKNIGFLENRKAPRLVAEIASAAGDTDLLVECNRVFLEFLETQAKGRGYLDPTEPVAFAGSLVEAGRIQEAEQILDTLRKLSVMQINRGLAEHLKPLEMMMELRKGNWDLATPVVWLDADRATPEQATLVWDLGVLNRVGGGVPQPVVRGESAPALDGRLVAEIFFGEDAESMQPVARLSGVGSRGVWQGRLPFEKGFARVVVSQEDRVLFGEGFPISAGRNLFREHEAGEAPPSLPGGDVKSVKGGPSPDGEYLSFHPMDSNALSPNVVGVLRRAVIKPGHDYLLGGWLRVMGSHFVRLGWRCLDRDGKLLAEGQFGTAGVCERFWIRREQLLSWPTNNAQGQRLPIGAAFIEPTIQGDGAFDVAGLFLTELPMSTPDSAP